MHDEGTEKMRIVGTGGEEERGRGWDKAVA